MHDGPWGCTHADMGVVSLRWTLRRKFDYTIGWCAMLSPGISEVDCQALYTYNQVCHACYNAVMTLCQFHLPSLSVMPPLVLRVSTSRYERKTPTSSAYILLAHARYRMALWSQKLYIVIPLVLIILGHWSLILQGVLLKAEWVPGEGCAITKTNNTVLAATFIYSMCFDLVVLVLTAVKLAFPRGQRSQLMSMLFKDGLIYFMIA